MSVAKFLGKERFVHDCLYFIDHIDAQDRFGRLTMSVENRDSDGNLGQDVYRALLADILAARLKGGTPIQQRRLAEYYRVSRSPMRTALSRLEGEGLLVRIGDGELAVRTVNLRDYLHSIDVRIQLEPFAAAQAASHPDREGLKIVKEKFANLSSPENTDVESAWSFDDSLHGYIAERTKNPFIVEYISDLRRYTTIFERQLPVVRLRPGMQEHAAILAALESGRPDDARASMLLHLEVVRAGVLENY